MIFRKPYAFLIKNFKKIHVFLLILSLYVFYKLIDVNHFVREFMDLGYYDFYQDPVTNHITIWLRISILLLVSGSVALLFLLHHKKKPWKIYLVPLVEYFALFLVLGMIRSFFNSYSDGIETTDLRLSRDLLRIFFIAQIPAIAIFIVRVTGLDIRKFNFNSDEEFLQLSEADREEFEVNINIDQYSFKRGFRKIIRNIQYFYIEHKAICRAIIAIVVVFSAFQLYRFIFVTNRSYSEGNNYSVNGYTITVHNSYYTDKDYTGNIISKKTDFLIVDLTVVNHDAPRKLKIDNFHIKNGTKDYISTNNTYSKEFQDFGVTYNRVKELQRDESFHFIIVYQVDKNLKLRNYNLFYQEHDYLRKIKLNVKDYRKIQDEGVISSGDKMTFTLFGEEETVSFDYYEFNDSVSYFTRSCNSVSCSVNEQNYTANGENTVLIIDFASNSFEGKDMVDFSIDYGKIVYIDNSNGENEKVEIDFHYPFSRKATGKHIYALVPKEVESSSSIEIIYTVRNKKYVYKLV